MISTTNYNDGEGKSAPFESFYVLTVIVMTIYGKFLIALEWGWK